MRGLMLRPGRAPGANVACLLLAATVLLPGAAFGQGISGVTVTKNGPNSPDASTNPTVLAAGFQRRSTTSVVSSSASAFQTRYAWFNAADSDNFAFNSVSTMTSDYRVNFSVTVPGAYDLLVTTTRNAGFVLENDAAGGNVATASMSAINGTQSGGSLSGSLGFAAPGSPGQLRRR